MAFVSEDGTGLSNANSYSSVAYADAYFADRGILTWDGTDALKENWLIRATDYIDLRFRSRFKGSPLTPTQALAFPRKIYTVSCFPDDVKKACCEYALRAKTGALAPDPVVSETGQVVSKTEEKVGPIEEKITFSANASNSTIALFKPYPAADFLLAPWLLTGGRVIR